MNQFSNPYSQLFFNLAFMSQTMTQQSQVLSPKYSMNPTIKTLLQGVEVISTSGDLNQTVFSLLTDSRRVNKGSLFFALPGLRTNGLHFVEEAIGRGAVAIVTNEPISKMHGVACVHVKDVHLALAHIAKNYFEAPDQKMSLIGITGTNGKSSVGKIVQHLLKESNHKAGLLGTINYDLGGRTLPSYRTTPESVDVYSMLSQMSKNACTHAVLEVSSHGLEQKRVAKANFKSAIFLNLTHDHLDYHGDFENYYQAKKKLFINADGISCQNRLINLCDPYGQRLFEEISSDFDCVTFGIHAKADLQIRNVKLNVDGSKFQFVWKGEEIDVSVPLLGKYNVSNVAAAVLALLMEGISLSDAVKGLRNLPAIEGRMEKVDTGDQDFQVLVDYAHTPNALKNALEMLREFTPGRVLVVFGCGGDRDRSKRGLMTESVLQRSDFAWATADNPRKENLDQIFSDMKEACPENASIEFIKDRREAIRMAIEEAGPGDTILIAGKGHETYQEVGDVVIPFDDRLVARDLLAISKWRVGK